MTEPIPGAAEPANPGTQPQQQEQQPEKVVLPDDHPLVKTLAAQKEKIRELTAKAGKLDELEEANRSETEKVADRIAKAEAEAAAVPSKVAESLRAHLVDIHKIDTEDADLFLTATDPELLLKQVTRLLGQAKGSGVPQPNRQQGQASLGRGGTLNAGRERYAETHK